MRLQPGAILVPSSTVARGVQAASTTIPIVSAGAGDLVASGLAASHARPGGNVTGLSTPALTGKQLQLLQEAVPALARVAVLFDRTNGDFRHEPYEAAASVLGLHLQFVGAGVGEALDTVFESIVREHADGLFVSTGPAIASSPLRIASSAMRRGLPSMWQQGEGVGHGGSWRMRRTGPPCTGALPTMWIAS